MERSEKKGKERKGKERNARIRKAKNETYAMRF